MQREPVKQTNINMLVQLENPITFVTFTQQAQRFDGDGVVEFQT
jgi:hypothetical protein